VQKVSVFLFGHGYALEHENQSATRGTHVDGLVGRIQYQHGRKQSMPITGPVSGRSEREQPGMPGSSVVIHPQCHKKVSSFRFQSFESKSLNV
jgi:hypothetical protein